MNVITRSKVFSFVDDTKENSVIIYTFKKSNDCFNQLSAVVSETFNYISNIKLNQFLVNHYIEADEFSLDFENHRFYINGNTRFFKIRYMGDCFDINNENDYDINDQFKNINLTDQWIKDHTYEYVNKNIFGKILYKKLLCKEFTLIPTVQTIPISYKHMNVNREIKLVEY